MQAGALVAHDGIFALFAGLPQRLVEFSGLAVGDVEHTLRLPNGAAAHLFQSLGEDDLITRLAAQLDHLVDEGVFYWCAFGKAHRLVDARGEIDHLEVALLANPAGLRLFCLARHSGRP